MALVVACEWSVCVSATDLVSWPQGGQPVANDALASALAAMGVDADPCELYRLFFEAPVGRGDVLLFSSAQHPQSAFVIDLYRGLTDQLDLVCFGARCSEHMAGAVRQHLRRFFDAASCQVGYEEASISVRLREWMDRSRYPYTVAESGYSQRLVERPGQAR